MLRCFRIEPVFSQVFFTGYQIDAIPRHYQPEISRLRADAAIASRYDDLRASQYFEAGFSTVAASLVADHFST
jgi:hypothetical protein